MASLINSSRLSSVSSAQLSFFHNSDAFLLFRRWDSTSVSSCLYTYHVCFMIRLQRQSQNTKRKCQALTPSYFWWVTDKENTAELGQHEQHMWAPQKAYRNLTAKQDGYWGMYEPSDVPKENKTDRKRNSMASKGAQFYKAWLSFMRNK